MIPYEPGFRIGATLDSNDHEVRLLGYGVYAGMAVPPDDLVFLGITRAEMREQYRQALVANRTDLSPEEQEQLLLVLLQSPKLVLDDGQVVWGCECWWGPEEHVLRSIAGKTVRLVTIAAARADAHYRLGCP